MTTPQNITDLQAFRSGGLAYASWNTGDNVPLGVGFDYKWNLAQIDAGYRVIPSFKWARRDQAEAMAFPWMTDALSSIDRVAALGLPMILRANQVAEDFVAPKYRTPKPWLKIPDDSALMWSRQPDGTLNDEAACDWLANPELWRKNALAIAQSKWVQQLMQRHPNPPFVIFADNHEACYGDPPTIPGKYVTQLGWPNPKPKNAEGKTTEQPIAFLPPKQVALTSARMADRLANGGVLGPQDEYIVWANNRQAHFTAYFDGMLSIAPPAWKAGFVPAIYRSGGPEPTAFRKPDWVESFVGIVPNSRYANTGPSCYIGSGGDLTRGDLTDPRLDDRWVFQRYLRRKMAGRMKTDFVPVYMNIGADDTLKGYLAGKHDVVTPEHWGAMTAWAAWEMHEPGLPVLIHHYQDSREKPGDPFFADTYRQTLADAGHSELAELTKYDYTRPMLQAINKIMDDPKIRPFWMSGTPIRVTPVGPVQVWVSVSQLGENYLLYAWTPCPIKSALVSVPLPDGRTLTVPVSFAGKPWCYRIGRPAALVWEDVN